MYEYKDHLTAWAKYKCLKCGQEISIDDYRVGQKMLLPRYLRDEDIWGTKLQERIMRIIF